MAECPWPTSAPSRCCPSTQVILVKLAVLCRASFHERVDVGERDAQRAAAHLDFVEISHRGCGGLWIFKLAESVSLELARVAIVDQAESDHLAHLSEDIRQLLLRHVIWDVADCVRKVV
jgi:hypothetical protein